MAEQLPFADFLDFLRAAGIQVGLGDYQAVAKLLTRLRTTDAKKLGVAIAAILGRNESELERIKELFAAYCSNELMAPREPPRLPPSQPALRVKRKRGRSVQPGALLVLGLLAVALLLIEVPRILPTRNVPDMGGARIVDAHPVDRVDLARPVDAATDQARPDPERPPATSPPAASSHTKTAPVGSDESLPRDGGAAAATAAGNQCAAPSTALPPAPPLPVVAPHLRRGRLAAVLAGGLALLLLNFLLGRRFAGRLQRSRRVLQQLPGPTFYQLQLRDLPPPLTREELDHLATLFDRLRVETGASRNIDLRRSLLQRVQQHLPPLIFARSQRRCALVILRDQSPELRPFARLIDTFIAGLQDRGISVRCYFFRGNADWVSEHPDETPLRLEELLPLAKESAFFVFSSTVSLLTRQAAARPEWLRGLAQLPRRVWLLSDLELLPHSSMLHELAVPVFPQSYRGLILAMRALLLGEQRVSADRWPAAPPLVTEVHVDRLQQLVQLAPYATPELAELLRQRYAPEVPQHILGYLVARSMDRSGDTLAFVATAEERAGQLVVSDGDPLRSAIVRRYLLQVLRDSEPTARGSLAHLRWRLDCALLTLQIPDPRQVLHPAAQRELLLLMQSPLIEEVNTTAAQMVRQQQLPTLNLPSGIRRQVAAANPSWLRWSVAHSFFLLGPMLLSAAVLWGANKAGWLHWFPKIIPNTMELTLKEDSTFKPAQLTPLPSASFVPFGQSIFTLSAAGTLEVWEIARLLRQAKPSGGGSGSNQGFFVRDEVKPRAAEPQILTDSQSAILAAQFSPDGNKIFAGSSDGVWTTWNANGTSDPVVIKDRRDVAISLAAFSIDGQKVITYSSGDRYVRIWNGGGSVSRLELQGLHFPVTSVAFSPDGKKIVTGSRDGTVGIWNADGSGSPIVLKGHQLVVTSVAFSPDSKKIVTGSMDRTARIWNADGSGTTVLLALQEYVYAVTFSPDGKRVAIGSVDSRARIWNADGSGSPIELVGHKGSFYSVAFSPDGSKLLTASDDKTAREWALDGSGQYLEFAGHAASVTSAAYSSDGRRIVTASADGTVRIWTLPEPLTQLGDTVTSASASPDGQRLVLLNGGATAWVNIWLIRGVRMVNAELKGHTSQIVSASFSPDGSRVVTASADQTARIWDAGSGKEMIRLTGHLDRLLGASYSPGGSYIFTNSEDTTVQIWDAQSGRQLKRLYGNKEAVAIVRVSPDGERVVTVERGAQHAQLFAVPSGVRTAVLTGHAGAIEDAAFSPDSSLIATASAQGPADLWSAASGQLLATLSPPCGGVYRVAFSPSGEQVATGSTGGAIQLWTTTGQGPDNLPIAHEGAVTSLAFSANSDYLLSAGTDHVPKLYELATHRSVAWVQSERRFAAIKELQRLGDLTLSSDLSGFTSIGQISSAALDRNDRIPLPTPDRPHYFRAENRNVQGDVGLSPLSLIPAVTPNCLGSACPQPASQAEHVQLRGNRLIANVYRENTVNTVTESLPVIDEVARFLKWRQDITEIRIEGHENSNDDYNSAMTSTALHARQVRLLLIARGVEAERLTDIGFGFTCPLVPNDTPENRALNRRLDFTIIAQAGVALDPPKCRVPSPLPQPPPKHPAARKSAAPKSDSKHDGATM